MVTATEAMVKSVAILSGLTLAASFAGALHPLGDSLAVFRVPVIVVTALAVIWSNWPRRLRWPLAGLALALLACHVEARVVHREVQSDLTLYQQNLLMGRNDNDAFLALVHETDPDVVTLQEVSTRNLSILAALEQRLPSQHHCPLGPWLGEAVLSRHPMVPGTAFCSDPDGLAGMQVDTPLGRIWLVSVHLRWPWPYGQSAQVDGLIPWLERLDGPVIMAGDFNAVAWSHTLRRMARASRTDRVGAHLHSYAGWPVPFHLGIDHVLAPETSTGTVRQMPEAGADHHGILAHLRWP